MPTATFLETVVTELNPPITSTIIWLHGLGADGYDFAGIVPQLALPKALGIRFVFPHAPLRAVTINNGYVVRAWYDIYRLDDLSQEDSSGMEDSSRAVAQLIQQQNQAGIPTERIILAGFSQGGAIALYTGLRYPQPLAGILGLSAYLPLTAQTLGQASAANRHTSIALAHGTQDNVLPIQLGEVARDLLLQAGYPVDWHSYSMGHQVCEQEIRDISQWIINVYHHCGSSRGN